MSENSVEYWSSEAISREYAVGPQRLFAFAMRGNLPMRVEDGERVYAVEFVKKLFRHRDAPEGQGMTLGGGFRLGDTLENRVRTSSVVVPKISTPAGRSRRGSAARSAQAQEPAKKADVA